MKIFWSYFISLSVLCFFLFSCENEESLIGENFLLDDEHEVFILHDSLINISSFSAIEDSVNAQSSTNLLGSYLDPTFGQADASFCFQITLPTNEMNFNANSITSAKLHLPYTGFYGDSLVQFELYASKLTTNISVSDSSEYFSNQTFSSIPIIPSGVSGSSMGMINLSEIQDSAALIVELPVEFVLTQIFQLSSEELLNTETFVETFNGFKLEVAPINSINGAIMYFNTADENAVLNVEYLDADGMEQFVNFPISNGSRLNHFNHDYSNTSIETTDSLLFLQSMSGSFSELNFEFLEALQDSGYIVNKAELSFSIFNNNETLQIPEQLTLVEYSNDDLLSIEGLSGGVLSDETNTYEFDITQHVQKILTENHNPICRLYTYARTSNADRIILNNTQTNPIQLKLILIKG